MLDWSDNNSTEAGVIKLAAGTAGETDAAVAAGVAIECASGPCRDPGFETRRHNDKRE